MYETKHKNACLKWSGLPIIVTSNRLPAILTKEYYQQSEQDKYDYDAF